MPDIPEYVSEAIKNGDAFITTDREEVKKILRRKLMAYLKDLDEDYIQEEIDGWTEVIMEKDYMYYTDLDLTLIKFIPDYVRLTVEKLLEETTRNIQKIIDDAKGDISGK